MEPEGSLPHSQVPATCPYPEPDRSSPHHTSNFSNIQLNIIVPSRPGSSKWSLSLKFPHQNPVYTSALPHMRYIPRPSHSSLFDHPNNIGWGVQNIKLLIMFSSTNVGNFLTSWEPVSFPRRTLLHAVSIGVLISP